MKYVVGHKNPDTDSFCSAVVYAQYLRDQGDQVQAIVLGEANLETQFIFNHVGVDMPSIMTTLPAGTEIVLVDHNEASQSIDGRENLIIDTVIDHHKVADFSTGYPVKMRLEKVGCTCTILAEMFDEVGYTPSPEMAGLMMSAIISDTLYFRSPTTTDRDKQAVEKLLYLTSIDDAASYSMQMFGAKSDLGDIAAEDMVTMDYKTFDFSGHSMGIGVLETTNPGYALGRKEELIIAIQKIKSEQQLEQLLLCVVDILEERVTAIVASEQEKMILQGAFNAETDDNIADLGARVSRKKQLVPPIDDYFAS